MVKELLEHLNGVLRADARLNDQVYPDFAPETVTGTAAVYQLISDIPEHTFQAVPDEKEFAVDVRVYSGRRMEADAIRDDLADTLDGLSRVNLGGFLLTSGYVDGFRNNGDPQRREYEASFTWNPTVERL